MFGAKPLLHGPLGNILKPNYTKGEGTGKEFIVE
jgi:hypothetical protein